jgi:hypothetical protein
MRDCPAWFQDELSRIGGLNPYGEPVFRLLWSTEPRKVIGGHWEKDGFVGYKEVSAASGVPCWALMVWEAREVFGSPDRWEIDYRDEGTGLLQCGGYPKHGRYRLLQRFIHREMVRKAQERCFMVGHEVRREVISAAEFVTYRMEPCGFMLDVMLPMLIRWRRLSDEAKVKALLQEEQLRNEDFIRKTKDALDGTKLGRVMRGSQLVQKRAEIIDRGFRQAMAVAAHTGLGMRVSA